MVAIHAVLLRRACRVGGRGRLMKGALMPEGAAGDLLGDVGDVRSRRRSLQRIHRHPELSKPGVILGVCPHVMPAPAGGHRNPTWRPRGLATYRQAQEAGKLAELPTNHNSRFVLVTDPTLRTGVETLVTAA